MVGVPGGTPGPLPLTICASSAGGNVPLGNYTGSLKITDSFNQTVTVPVTLIVTSSVGSEIAIFRSNNPGSGGPAQFAFDVNGNIKFDPGIDTFRQFGLDGDIPVAGDWDGTGVVRIGVYRPSMGAWYLDLNNNGTWDGVSGGDGVYFFGLPGDMPVVGDWSGNGVAKFGVFRCPAVGQPGVCTWILDYAGKKAYDPSTAVMLSYGLPGDLPVVGNWTGNGTADQVGVFRCPASGQGVCTWIVNSTGTGFYSSSDAKYQYGLPGDRPIVGNWGGSGRKRIGVWRQGLVVLNVSGSNTFGYNDQIGSFGLPGDQVVVGSWSGPITNFP
jgi:hypothetical protein